MFFGHMFDEDSKGQHLFAGACAAAETHGPALSGHGLFWREKLGAYLKLWHVIVILCLFMSFYVFFIVIFSDRD